jgi:hypothetical protein
MSSLARLKAQFDVMEGLVTQAASGSIRGLIIFGPAGIGKTYNVEKALFNYRDRVAPLVGVNATVDVCKGHMTTVGLVEALWRNRESSNTLVLDDIDTVLEKLDALNILKAALDSGSQRTISYMSQNAALKKSGIPKQFDYNGSVILITNQDMENCTSKMAPHFKALVSRCYYFDLGFGDDGDSFAWIRHVSETTGMLGNEQATKDILGYMKRNLPELRELSLRTALKIKHVYTQPNWNQIADFTVLTSD